MIEYRIKTSFRIAAWFPALFFCGFGISAVIVGFRAVASGQLQEIFTLLLGLVMAVGGLLFLRLAWTGRVPAFVEEYSLDTPDEVERYRFEARREGRLIE